METLIGPAIVRKLGYAWHDLRHGLPVLGLLMSAWALMAFLVAPTAPRHVAAPPRNPVVACQTCAPPAPPQHHQPKNTRR